MSRKISLDDRAVILKYLKSALRGCSPLDSHAMTVYKTVNAKITRCKNHLILTIPVYGKNFTETVTLGCTPSDRKSGINNALLIYRTIYSSKEAAND